MSRCSFDKSFKIVAVKLIIEESFSVKEVSSQLDVHAK
ncbi:transposase [Enterococcus larvae]